MYPQSCFVATPERALSESCNVRVMVRCARGVRWAQAAGLAAFLAGCGGAAGGNGSVAASAASAPNAASAPSTASVASAANVELVDAESAIVGGQRVAFDGVREGLAWPALAKALGRREGDTTPLTIAVRREVPMENVVRAVWTLRGGDVRLQSPDDQGTLRAIDLRAKPAARQPGCHLAVFVQADRSLRIAAPGGARTITGDAPNDQLARALDAERTRCPIRYVAFGAQTADAAWGTVFDVALAVDRAKSAGDARYVLGEPVHLATKR